MSEKKSVIRRQAARRDERPAETELKNATFEWDRHERCVKIRASFVPDFNTPSKHNYTVTIPWHECKRILGAFADAMVSTDEG